MNIKVLVVEDEFTIAMDIEQRLMSMNFDVVGIAVNYNEALPYLVEKRLDVVLLDINLEDDKSGIDLGKIIQDKFNIPIVFLTAYTDDKTFESAQQANPMGYLNKPFKDSDLKHTLQLAVNQYKIQNKDIPNNKTTTEFIFIKDKGQHQKIAVKDILWLEAMDNYTVVHLNDKKLVANSFLKDMLQLLGDNFYRIHRSHAVALNKITSIDDHLLFINDITLPISKSCKSGLMNHLKMV